MTERKGKDTSMVTLQKKMDRTQVTGNWKNGKQVGGGKQSGNSKKKPYGKKAVEPFVRWNSNWGLVERQRCNREGESRPGRKHKEVTRFLVKSFCTSPGKDARRRQKGDVQEPVPQSKKGDGRGKEKKQQREMGSPFRE